MLHPAIPDGRTWIKLGEHEEQRERGEHGNDEKHQLDDLIPSIAKGCLLNGQEQACSKIIRLFGCLGVAMPKTTQHTGKWL